MKGPEILKLRERHGWSQTALADLLNPALDRRYTSSTISSWERGDKPTPAHVAAFLDALEFEQAAGVILSEGPEPPPRGEDDAPTDPTFSPQMPTGPASIYSKVCEELFEMIAMGVGMTGALIGSDKLQADGAIIDADKKALGRAYGKLAETNETFRRMLTNMTGSGAWLEVCFVTGGTVAKVWHNHAAMGELVQFPDETTAPAAS